jgi:hypothetical protein
MSLHYQEKNPLQIGSPKVKRQQIIKYVLHLLTYIVMPFQILIDLKFKFNIEKYV